VPRAWTHLLGIVSGQPVDPDTPTPERWRAEMGESAPLTMSDGADVSFRHFHEGFAPHSRVDQAIHAIRVAVFPELGIDPSL
jgi:acetoin utilization protein AcuC